MRRKVTLRAVSLLLLLPIGTGVAQGEILWALLSALLLASFYLPGLNNRYGEAFRRGASHPVAIVGTAVAWSVFLIVRDVVTKDSPTLYTGLGVLVVWLGTIVAFRHRHEWRD